MTTEAAANLYLAQHQLELEGVPFAVHNPHGKEIDELPVIYGLRDGGGMGFQRAIALSEDGYVLGTHLCSHEGYVPHGLGCLKLTRPDRHRDQYIPHYPDGYRMEFVPSEQVEGHAKLNEAIRLGIERERKEREDEKQNEKSNTNSSTSDTDSSNQS